MVLICGECGARYRRATWSAKGFKEIKWRCIKRIQFGKKNCHNSLTIDEQALHKAIVSAINRFCEVKDDVAKVLREFIETEKAKHLTAQRGSVELDTILKRLENEDFTMAEYDDVAVRQLIEKITVES